MPGQGGDYYAQLSAASEARKQAALELSEAVNRRDQLQADSLPTKTGDRQRRCLHDASRARQPGARRAHQVAAKTDGRAAPTIYRATSGPHFHQAHYRATRRTKRKAGSRAQETDNGNVCQSAKPNLPANHHRPGRGGSQRRLTAGTGFPSIPAATGNSRPPQTARPRSRRTTPSSCANYDVYRSNYQALLARRDRRRYPATWNPAQTPSISRVDRPAARAAHPFGPNRPMLYSLVLSAASRRHCTAFLMTPVTPHRRRPAVPWRPHRPAAARAVALVETPEAKQKKRKGLLRLRLCLSSVMLVPTAC